MLDLPRLERVRLSARPLGQRVVAWTYLWPNYVWPPRVEVVFEGTEHIPNEPVIFAMNHTDRFNYWPFQYFHYKRHDRFTATWVKGKYYERPLMAFGMEKTNNIPTMSRGYVITRDFVSTLGRRPDDAEYAYLRRLVDAQAGLADPSSVPPCPTGLERLFETPRDLLGRLFEPAHETYAEAVDALFRAMTARFVALNAEAFDLGLDLLVFPQGTRSKRLSRGRIGLSQIALAFERTVVPVGCSGSDRCYPGNSGWAKPGKITYRFGAPLRYSDVPELHTPEPFVPFTAEAERTHRERFQAYADRVMARIEPLVDPEYRFAPDGESEGVVGSERFI